MKTMTHAALPALIAAAVMFPLTANATGKFAVVDLQTVLATTKAGKAAKKQFQSLQARKKKQLKRRDNKLKATEKKLAAEKQALTKELAKSDPRKISPVLRAKAQTFEAKVRQFQTEVVDFQKTQREALKQLATKEAALLKPIETKIKGVIAKLAKERGYAMVVNKVTVVYNVSAVDITNEVIRRMGK